MMDSFKSAVEVVLDNEKGYVNDPNDPGGETKYGISKRSYPHLNIKELTRAQAEKIFFTDFWLKFQCDKITNDAVAIKFLDLCVNMGGKQATLCLQRACKACGIHIADDGIIGPNTLRAVHVIGVNLLNPLKSEAAGFYRLITAMYPKNEEYISNWLNRAYS